MFDKISILWYIFTRRELLGMTREELVTAPKRNARTVSEGSKSYLAQPRVQEFNKEIRKRVFNSTGVGRPYAFSSLEVTEKEVDDYFQLCSDKEVVPTITTLALWLGVNKDTIYAHANNSSSPFSDLFKNVISYCHSLIQNGAIDGKINPVTYFFISKNDYGMRDDKNITVSATQGSNINTQETADALRKQIEEETTPNVTIVDEQ